MGSTAANTAGAQPIPEAGDPCDGRLLDLLPLLPDLPLAPRDPLPLLPDLPLAPRSCLRRPTPPTSCGRGHSARPGACLPGRGHPTRPGTGLPSPAASKAPDRTEMSPTASNAPTDPTMLQLTCYQFSGG